MTIHQPAKDEYEKFNLAFIMGYGGIPTYFGPTGEPSYRFFGRSSRTESPYRAAAGAERASTTRATCSTC